MNITQHNVLRKGNLLLYQGKLKDYFNTFGEIISIERINDEDIYQLKVKNWKKEENIITVDKNEIMPINLEVDHLNKLGFKKVEKMNIFQLNGLTIVRPMIFYNGGEKIVDEGFMVLENNITPHLNKTQIDEAKIPVPSLHSLQNYFYDNLNYKIDFTLFL